RDLMQRAMMILLCFRVSPPISRRNGSIIAMPCAHESGQLSSCEGLPRPAPFPASHPRGHLRVTAGGLPGELRVGSAADAEAYARERILDTEREAAPGGPGSRTTGSCCTVSPAGTKNDRPHAATVRTLDFAAIFRAPAREPLIPDSPRAPRHPRPT